MAFINDITINISRGTLGLQQQVFRPLIMGSGPVIPTASGVTIATKVSDITDAGFAITDAEYLMGAAMFAQTPSPEDIAIVRKASGTTYAAALTTLRTTYDDFYAVTIESREKTDLAAVGTWANSNKKMFFGGTDDITALDSRNVDREAYLVHNNSDTDYPECAWVGKVIPTTPGSATWKWQILSGQNASTFTSTQLNTIRTNKGQALQNQKGAIFTNEGVTTSGEYIDIIIGQDWVEDQMVTDLLSLFLKNDKVAFDDVGIGQVEGVVRDVLKRAGDNGIIAAAVSDTDLENSDDKEYIYTVTVVSRADSPANERALRTYNGISFVYTTAGAIHKVTVTGYIEV
jgi:hypothetical protein